MFMFVHPSGYSYLYLSSIYLADCTHAHASKSFIWKQKKFEVTHNIVILLSYNIFSTYMCMWHRYIYQTINVLRVVNGIIKHRQGLTWI